MSGPSVTEYRLSWESPSPLECDGYEQLNGKDVWQRFDWSELWLTWHPTTVTFRSNEGVDRLDQYRTLKEWADTRYQPIRNVTLEQRTIVGPDEGWEPAGVCEEHDDCDGRPETCLVREAEALDLYSPPASPSSTEDKDGER